MTATSSAHLEVVENRRSLLSRRLEHAEISTRLGVRKASLVEEVGMKTGRRRWRRSEGLFSEGAWKMIQVKYEKNASVLRFKAPASCRLSNVTAERTGSEGAFVSKFVIHNL